MPANTPSQAYEAERFIRAIVVRLARPDGQGAAVIERAAIMAEGGPAGEIEAWIIAHGGQPETPLIPPPGLHGPRTTRTRAPRRYVISTAALDA